MLRGIITGLFFGGVLGLMLSGIVSLLAPLPSNVAVPQAQEPTASQPAAESTTSLSGTSDTDAPVQADSVAQSPAAVDGVDGAPIADQASAPRPATGNVEGAPATPAENGDVDVALQSDSPVLPNPQANPITRPGAEDEPSISIDPAQPQSPGNVDTQAFDAPALGEDSNAPVIGTDRSPTQVTPAQQGQTDNDAPPSVDVATADPAERTVEEPVEPAEDNQETASLLKPVDGFDKSFEQRKSTRLPTVGTSATQETATDIDADTAATSDQPPLAAFAAPFEATPEKPLMSVVLIDDTAAGDEILSTLADFPLPVSIAIDALAEGAAERSAKIRASGLEVLALVNLPAGASASDVEVNLSAMMANVPEAVALIDGLDGGLQETRGIADQVITRALASGHGVVFQPKGLNTSQKLAVREGVGAVTVFRDLDGSGQSEIVIRRFLDQAAFKARQNEAVLMLGRLQSSTIAALASWALQDRASTVSVAPASALLQGTLN